MSGLGLSHFSIVASIINWLLMILFIGGFTVLVLWFVTKLNRNGGGSSKETPIDIVRQRYAKGELTKEQFDQIKKDLNQ